MVALREDLDRAPQDLAAAAWERLRDLRVWFGAQPAEEADEVAALERTLEPMGPRRRSFCASTVSRRRGADEPGDVAALDMEATYTVAYRPSSNVVWAWRNLRAIEDAGYELERAGALERPSFNLAFHVPEALRRRRGRRRRSTQGADRRAPVHPSMTRGPPAAGRVAGSLPAGKALP